MITVCIIVNSIYSVKQSMDKRLGQEIRISETSKNSLVEFKSIKNFVAISEGDKQAWFLLLNNCTDFLIAFKKLRPNKLLGSIAIPIIM